MIGGLRAIPNSNDVPARRGVHPGAAQSLDLGPGRAYCPSLVTRYLGRHPGVPRPYACSRTLDTGRPWVAIWALKRYYRRDVELSAFVVRCVSVRVVHSPAFTTFFLRVPIMSLRQLPMAILLSSCALTLGCRGDADAFPLDGAIEWRYAITRDLGVDTVSRYVDGTVNLDGKLYTALATRWADGSVTRMLYRRDAAGIYARSDGAGAIEALLIPRELTAGRTWMIPVGGGQAVVATIGEAEQFAGPDGRYSDCHRIEWAESGTTNFFLLCPGVGVAKARYGAREELLIGTGPGQERRSTSTASAGARTAEACANDQQSGARIEWSRHMWRPVLPAEMTAQLARSKPGFAVIPSDQFPADMQASLGQWYPPGSQLCSSPYAVFADFNGDGVVDAALLGFQGGLGALVGLLSIPIGYEFQELNLGRSGEEMRLRLALVAPGTALPPAGPDAPERMPGIGFVVNGLTWGPTYFYTGIDDTGANYTWKSVSSPGD